MPRVGLHWVLATAIVGVLLLVLLRRSTDDRERSGMVTGNSPDQEAHDPAAVPDEASGRVQSPTQPVASADLGASVPLHSDPLPAHLRAIERHRAELVDASWAVTAKRAFETELGAIGTKAKFRVVDVDCRTLSCLAVLEFDKYDDARQNFQRVLQARLTQRCGREITLENPRIPEARYQTTAVFDCSAARARE